MWHFTTSFRFLPWFHTVSVKPWNIDGMHKTLKLHEYDDLLNQYTELKNLYNYNDISQEEGLLEEKPFYIIANNDDSKSLNKLGDGEFTTVYETNISGNLISASDSESIVNALTKVLKERKKIDKANK